MGFLLRSKAEGNVGPRSSPAAAACSPELPGFAEHIQTASGSRLEPTGLGSLSSGARSLGKGCQPSHGPTRRPVPMRRCPVQRPQGGDVPGSSPALSKAGTEARSQYCLLHPEGCAFFFFFEASFPTAPFTSREKHAQNTTVLLRGGGRAAVLGGNSPWVFGNLWGNTGGKKKSTHPSFRPQYASANTHRWSAPPTSFHPAKNPGKHLNSGTGGAQPRPSGSRHSAHPVGRDSGSF